VQYASPFGGVSSARVNTPVGDEDCLTLNVFTPDFGSPASVPTGAARLPVMVWIHGGGNTIGQAAFYEGGKLATSQNVVVVTVQYRLGPFGWLRHASLRDGAASDAERSGNFGTLDLVRALEWVRDDIASFGGDPGNVTIFGESAGGQNVYSLLLSPPARGLFQRAIVESGGVWMASAAEAEHSIDDREPGAAQSSNEILLRLLQRDGLAHDRASAEAKLAAMSSKEVATYLRGKPANEILLAYQPIPGAGMIDMPRVFADGSAIAAGAPLDALGRPDGHAPVPVIAGTNRDENKLFMFSDPELIRWRFWILPRFVDENMYLTTAEYLARAWKARGADEPASALLRSGDGNVFVYRFDWDEEPVLAGADLKAMLGAAHGFEIPFVFGHFDLGREGNRMFTPDNAPGRETLSSAMMSYWAEFARSGNPGRGSKGDLPQWPAWSGTAPQTLLLDTPNGGGVRSAPLVERRDKILADVDADPRLATQRDRCRVFHELASRANFLTKEQYATAGKNGCAAYPYDGYPWSS
jgi:para-nitrobenzyl esterase